MLNLCAPGDLREEANAAAEAGPEDYRIAALLASAVLQDDSPCSACPAGLAAAPPQYQMQVRALLLADFHIPGSGDEYSIAK